MKEIPKFLDKLLEKEYGNDLKNKIIEGYSNKRFVTLRVNTIKSNCSKIKEVLDNLEIKYQEVTWYSDALIIENANENDLQELDIYKNGEIYLQSLSSMIPPLLLEPKKNESILDMTAAPGGKTTQMVALSNNEALITACEKNKIRSERLKYNLLKQGANRVGVIVNDARKLDDFLSFDKILLDAPCSGSGTLYLEEDHESFNQELVKRSSQIQFELLKKAINLLKPNHEMIYSTCSILKEENEQILDYFIKKKLVEVVPLDNEITKELPLLPTTIPNTICICPTELYEGFFVAKLRKK